VTLFRIFGLIIEFYLQPQTKRCIKMSQPTTERHRRLLSIDGGGVRGLISILILRRIMDKINEDRAEGLMPHEVFDLIGGIGTGG